MNRLEHQRKIISLDYFPLTLKSIETKTIQQTGNKNTNKPDNINCYLYILPLLKSDKSLQKWLIQSIINISINVN